MSLEQALAAYQTQVDTALDRHLPAADRDPARLHAAMRYAVLGPGKRVRPVLVYATGEALGTPLNELDSSAVAVELIHAYSLIHDDLPAMDDDDLRRGRATCHREFDEATAILAGDALQALAFSVLAECDNMTAAPGRRIEMLRELARAVGSAGMAGGQAMDLAAVGNHLTLAELEKMHLHKTGALIRASVRLGYLASRTDDQDVAARLDRYARCVGLAFQVHDDILDVEGETSVIGKPQGSDSDQNKPTYPNILGMETAKNTARELCDEAIGSIEPLGSAAGTLRQLADYIVRRDR
jgi:geranylgeranyl diphosphate synthase, type II